MACRRWLDAHLVDQWYLGKPVVIEEFGKAIGRFHRRLHGSSLQLPMANAWKAVSGFVAHPSQTPS